MGKSKYSRKRKIHIPKKIPINNSEKVLFTGKYNINNQINNGITYTLLPVISVNPNGYNPFVGNYYNTMDGLSPPNNLLLEYNNIASYSHNLKMKLGQIQFTGLDVNNTASDVASIGFRVFNINSADGIYEPVTKVIIDNRTPPNRTIYFIGKK
jgi:hypothetical protein